VGARVATTAGACSPGCVTPVRERTMSCPSSPLTVCLKPRRACGRRGEVSLVVRRRGRGESGTRTSATEMGSFQYRLLSFLTNPPFCFLLLTRTITSPATHSGLSSASPSKTTSAPSGMPRSMWRFRSECESTMRWPLHAGQTCLIDLPRPPHLSRAVSQRGEPAGRVESVRGDAPVAVHLHLLEDARAELMPHDSHAAAFADRAGDDVLLALCARACESPAP
jgi:hypothetical protein